MTFPYAHALLFGASLKRPLAFEPRADDVLSGPVLRMLDYVIAEAGREDSAFASPLVAERMSEALVQALLRFQPHDHTAMLATAGAVPAPRYVRLAEEYMTANSDREITSALLVGVTGVGMRALQGAFRAHRATTPTRFLRDRRLDVARARLLAAPWRTITDVALSSGLVHFGRFGQSYRARFGESPAETRRRARAA